MTTKDLLKLCFWTILVFLIGALGSCSKEPGLNTATGEYSYRISGTARIYFADRGADTTVVLTPEQGTMTVVRSKEADKAVATLFADDGTTYELPLYFTHDTIWIDEPVFRDITVSMSDRNELFHIRITGEGQVMSSGDLALHLGYSGRSRNTSHDWSLTANPVSVHFNAKKL